MKTLFKDSIAAINKFPILFEFLKWLLLSLAVGVICGCASAFFLVSLEWVTNYRENHTWIIVLLPLGGLAIGLLYHYYGSTVVKGNNLLLEELHTPKNIIPFRMAPLVLAGTLITHLFGGSAGREGTAVQMGGAIADRFTSVFNLNNSDRRLLIIAGMSGGFASVFGTPLAGAVFALEVMLTGKLSYKSIAVSFITAFVAHYTCLAFNVEHTHYTIPVLPPITFLNLTYAAGAGVIFGFTARMFSISVHFWSNLFRSGINYPPLRPVVGGVVIVLAVFLLDTTKYIGLGVPVIQEAFVNNLNSYDFLLKLVFTTFTLGAGFKGGEVTPLFFVGAALGNALSLFIPLPLALMAGIGFVAVFCGAVNTPVACILMGIELFGIDSFVYVAIACIMAYFTSGHKGIYTSQIHKGPKAKLKGRLKYF